MAVLNLTPIYELFLLMMVLLNPQIKSGAVDLTEDGKVVAQGHYIVTSADMQGEEVIQKFELSILEKDRISGTLVMRYDENGLYTVSLDGGEPEVIDMSNTLMDLNRESLMYFKQAVVTQDQAILVTPLESALSLQILNSSEGIRIPEKLLK